MLGLFLPLLDKKVCGHDIFTLSINNKHWNLQSLNECKILSVVFRGEITVSDCKTQ